MTRRSGWIHCFIDNAFAYRYCESLLKDWELLPPGEPDVLSSTWVKFVAEGLQRAEHLTHQIDRIRQTFNLTTGLLHPHPPQSQGRHGHHTKAPEPINEKKGTTHLMIVFSYESPHITTLLPPLISRFLSVTFTSHNSHLHLPSPLPSLITQPAPSPHPSHPHARSKKKR